MTTRLTEPAVTAPAPLKIRPTTMQSVRRFASSDRLRSAGLLLILALLAVTFQVLTSGLFLSPRNLSLLSVQVALTAMLAAGIVLVMVPGHIDLSIGAAVALTGIVTALSVQDFGLSPAVAAILTLAAGSLIGVWHGFWIAVMNVPSFIVTLASLLGLRGVALLLTQGSTPAPGPEISALATTYLPAPWTIAIFGVLFVGTVLLAVRERRARRSAGMAAPLTSLVIVPAVSAGLGCAAALWVYLAYQGLPLPVAVLIVVVVVISIVLRYTRFGRQLYAIGGNAVAAGYAGVRTRLHSFVVFAVMGLLAGAGGLLLVSRLGSAPPGAANGLELNVIAAAVIGGTSLLGGIGTVGGAVIGAILMESLNNGMSLLNLPSYWQQIAVGLVLLVAVYVDLRARRGRGGGG